MSRKAVHDFELTLAECALDKLHVYTALSFYCNGLIVASECHDNGNLHYHCYLETIEKVHITDVREFVELNVFADCFEISSIHISPLRNRKHWISYCTKEDTEPLFRNVDTSLFNRAYKIHKFVTGNSSWNPLHPFLRQNPMLNNIVKNAHTEYWASVARSAFDDQIMGVIPNTAVGWVQEAQVAAEAGKHVYVYGPSGVGKSVWARHFMRGRGNAVTLPCGMTHFEFSDIDGNAKLVLAPDAPKDYLHTHRQMLLQLADRHLVAINPKCSAIRQVLFTGQLIILSNFEFPDTDPALLRRFQIIYADCDGIQAYIPPEEAVKTPTLHEEEVIEISSEDETDSEIELPYWHSQNSQENHRNLEPVELSD